MAQTLPLLDAPANESEDAGFGALRTERGCLPLTAVEVRAGIEGLLAQTSVRQTFHNAFDEPLEATYIFPLPDRAAVTRFRMTVGERVIEGELKERGQARQDYAHAIKRGHRAALAEEDRSGVFTMQVGNIPPTEEVTVELDLVGPLEMNEDEATYRFPLVVAPRYTPGVPLDGAAVGDGVTPDTDQVPDASRVTPPVLLPGFPNPVRLSLEVELDPAGLNEGLSGVRSSLHSVLVNEQGPPWTVRLQPGERLNRDFLLRFPVARQTVQTTLQCSAAAPNKPGVFSVTLTPPMTSTLTPKPREVVFVLDRSGSMSGWKMVAARRALGRMIDTLLDQDRFTVIAFDDTTEMPTAPAEANSRGKLLSGANRQRWRVLEWLSKIDARGGTEMGPALKAAVQCFSPASDNVDRVLVVVTDGQVTGEDALLRTLKKAAGGAMPRVFTLGIDQAVNAGFLHRLADLGGGVCDLVESEDRLDEALDGVHRLIGQPVLTDVRLELVDFDGVAESLAPARTAGLYAGRPLMIFGRHLAPTTNIHLRVHAVDAAGQPWSAEVAAQDASPQVLLNLWGRAQVRQLEDRYAAEGVGIDNLAERIVQVSLESGVLSRFTAYVAVDQSEVVNAGGKQHHVIQPVEVPAGWDDDLMLASYAAPDAMQLDSTMMMDPSRVLASRSPARRNRRRYDQVDSCLQEFDDHDAPLNDDAGASHTARLAEAAGKLFGKLTGRRKRALDLSSLDAAISDLLTAIRKSNQAGKTLTHESFAHVVHALEKLAALLTHANHAAKDEILSLSVEGRGILEAWSMAGDVAAVETRLRVFLDDAARKLEALQTTPPRSSGAFWKTTGPSSPG